MKVGITGQRGFIGSHLYNYLGLQSEIELIEWQRTNFENVEKLRSFVDQCDTIIHLAALNRHSDPKVIYDRNIELTTNLIDACTAVSSKPHIIFSSSSQEGKDNLYGKSKVKCRELLEQWAALSGGKVTSLIIPNVFGPFGKPNYNSVVATFCYNVANNIEVNVHSDSNVSLIYINELVEEICGVIKDERNGRLEITHKHQIKVTALRDLLLEFKEHYVAKGIFPSITEPFQLALFNTFRCYLPNDSYPRSFVKHSDNRGSFVEIARTMTPGQFSYSTTKPGVTPRESFPYDGSGAFCGY